MRTQQDNDNINVVPFAEWPPARLVQKAYSRTHEETDRDSKGKNAITYKN